MNITRLKGDFEMVTHALPASLESVKIYTVADLHYGSQEFNIAKWTHFVTTLLEDENAYVVFAGDLIDCATNGSKTNIYEHTVGIRAQLDWLTEQLNLISHKVLAIVHGVEWNPLSYTFSVLPGTEYSKLCHYLKLSLSPSLWAGSHIPQTF